MKALASSVRLAIRCISEALPRLSAETGRSPVRLRALSKQGARKLFTGPDSYFTISDSEALPACLTSIHAVRPRTASPAGFDGHENRSLCAASPEGGTCDGARPDDPRRGHFCRARGDTRPGRGSRTRAGRSRLRPLAARQPEQPDHVFRAKSPDRPLRGDHRMPALRVAGRPAGRTALARAGRPAREALARCRHRAAQPGAFLPPSPAWRLDRRGHRRPARGFRLHHLPAGHRRNGPHRRRRDGGRREHHARTVRRPLETQRGHACPPQASQRRAVPAVLPRTDICSTQNGTPSRFPRRCSDSAWPEANRNCIGC